MDEYLRATPARPYFSQCLSKNEEFAIITALQCFWFLALPSLSRFTHFAITSWCQN